jgi:hypothetical protein
VALRIDEQILSPRLDDGIVNRMVRCQFHEEVLGDLAIRF